MKRLGLILAGGESKRLFPVSLPKPLLKIAGSSLLEQALERLRSYDVFVVTNALIASQIKEQFKRDRKKVPPFILEPEGRDTAAAVGFGIRKALQRGVKYQSVAVLSADHWIPDLHEFRAFLRKVEVEIERHPDSLFVAGSPSKSKPPQSLSPFGWILPEDSKFQRSTRVKEFIEKPSGKILDRIRTKNGLINGGMFFGMPEVFLKAYKEFYPEVLKSRLNYASLKKIPVDRAIFEKFKKVRVVHFPLRWQDLGTWQEWAKNSEPQRGDLRNSKNCFIYADREVQVHAFGVQNLAIVQSGKQILVMPLTETPHLKRYLED